MSALPQLERDLLGAATRALPAAPAPKGAAPRPRHLRTRLRHLRAVGVAIACALALATVALAATGVILSGAPVHPEEELNPTVGEGLPAPGGSQLLPLRIPDPEGGLPWGMRVVHTTRGEVCVQVGRLQGDVLGELGIDGAFENDARLHAIPPNALPPDVFHGRAFDGWLGSANATCNVAGEATVSQHTGLDRSAASNPKATPRPSEELRDVYFGLLGPQAVSVTYRDREGSHTEPVLRGVGAYLIVKPIRSGEQIETGGSSLGTPGDLAPSPPLTVISYRIDGRVCERGPSLPPGAVAHLSSPCPTPHWPAAPPQVANLHLPLHTHLLSSGSVITGVQVSFKAPHPVTSAAESYAVMMSTGDCPGARNRGAIGYTGESLAHNLRRGSTVTLALAYPFEYVCGSGSRGHLHLESFPRQTVAIQAVYHPRAGSEIVVGSAVLRAPAHARLTQPPRPSP